MNHLPLFDINYISNTVKGMHVAYGKTNPSLPFVKERVKTVIKNLTDKTNPSSGLTKLGSDFFTENVFPQEIFTPECDTVGKLRETVDNEQFLSMFSRCNVALAEIAPYNVDLFIKASEQWGSFGYNLLSYADSNFPTEILRRIAECETIGSNVEKEFNQYGNYGNMLTVAELTEKGFIINTSTPVGFKENIANIKEAHYIILNAKVTVRGANFGVYPFLLKIRDTEGRLLSGVHVTDYDEVFRNTSSGRMFLRDFKTSTSSLLSRFGSVTPSANGFSVDDFFKSEPLRQFVLKSAQNHNHVTTSMALTNIGFASLTVALGWALTYGRHTTSNINENTTVDVNNSFSPLISNSNVRHGLIKNYAQLYNTQLYNLHNIKSASQFFTDFSTWDATANVKDNRKMVSSLNIDFNDVAARASNMLTKNLTSSLIDSHISLLNIQGVSESTGLLQQRDNVDKIFATMHNTVELNDELISRISALHHSSNNTAFPSLTVSPNFVDKLFPQVRTNKNSETLNSFMYPSTASAEASNILTKHNENNEATNISELTNMSIKNVAVISHTISKLTNTVFRKYSKAVKEAGVKGTDVSTVNTLGGTSEELVCLWSGWLTFNNNLNLTMNILKHKLTPQGFTTALMLVERYGLDLITKHSNLINIFTPHLQHVNKQSFKRSVQVSDLLAPNIWFLLKDYGYDEDFLRGQDFVTILRYSNTSPTDKM